jgi:hypothetical protein
MLWELEGIVGKEIACLILGIDSKIIDNLTKAT